MKQKELMKKQQWSDRSDKEYLSVHIDEWTEKKIILSLNAEAEVIRINEKVQGSGKTVKEIQALTAPEGQFPEETLISPGAIVVLGEKTWEEAPMPLLLRDLGAPSDPNALTTPAGRLDMTMTAGIINELVEMIPFGTKDDRKVFFVPRIYDDHIFPIFTKEEDLLSLFQEGIEKNEGINDGYTTPQFTAVEPIVLPGMINLELRINGETVDKISSVYVFYDRKHNTLEYRKILRYPELDPSKIDGILDGDGFRRNILLTTPKSMAEYVSAITQLNREDIIGTFLKGRSENDPPNWGLKICGGTSPSNHWKWDRFLWNPKTGVPLPLTPTLAAFATEMLK